jgi:hypothetical protein
MSAPLRFIGVAILAWAGVRAASLGLFPGMTALAPPAAAASLPPLAPPPATEFAPPPPLEPQPYAVPAYDAAPMAGYPPYGQPYAVQPIVLPVRYAAQREAPRRGYANDGWAAVLPSPQPAYYAALADQPWLTPAAAAPLQSQPSPGGGLARSAPPPVPPAPARLDRLQLSAWALLRNRPGPTTLASGGTLGGSQAGARLVYRFTPAIAASLRFSSSVGGVRGAEVAGGLRWQPLRSLPVALTVERRQRLGRYGGRSAFAALVEGGLYQRPLGAGFKLDAYAQGGVVEVKQPMWFADGALTATRPLFRNISGGLGMWAGGQTGLYRVDAGPRLTLDIGRGLKMHLDYRQRLAGDALPQSGPALTVTGDF